MLSKEHTTILAVNSLSLSHYRNHLQLNLACKSSPIVLTGKNGLGKTNILEAVSLLVPGKGLRSACLEEITTINQNKCWKIAAEVNSTYGPLEIITTINDKSKRSVMINGKTAKSQLELAGIFSVSWLTPLMDQIFVGPSKNRRKLLDKLALNFDESHAQRLNQYEKLIAERRQILKKSGIKAKEIWLNAVEKNLSSLAVAIATSRIEAISYVQSVINDNANIFPRAELKIKGELEEQIYLKPSLQIEEEFALRLKSLREIDLQQNRTNAGIHRSDLLVYHGEKKMIAANCSTGEQKTLLLSIILAEAKARIRWKNQAPVMLLDEVVAHLDCKIRTKLFEQLLDMNLQCFLTGTDEQVFLEIKNRAQFINI
jgi:DNA replication and repair protein RecF